MRYTRGLILCVLSVSLNLGCASHSSKKNEPSPGIEGEVSVEVENHNWSDVVIYLLRGGQAERLGMVTAHSTGSFVVPYRRISSSGNTRLSAYPIGGRSAFNSEALLVQPGQSIKWTLETDLTRSSLMVY